MACLEEARAIKERAAERLQMLSLTLKCAITAFALQMQTVL